jgi:hypothetical protein
MENIVSRFCIQNALFMINTNERLPNNISSKNICNSEEKEVKTENTTKTWNGALSLSSTKNARLDLFFSGLVRDCELSKLESLLTKSWQENPEDTLKLIMHARDCRKGKGEKSIAIQSLLWLRKNKPVSYLLNLDKFLSLGCYKDLLHMICFAEDQELPFLGQKDCIELEIFAEDLIRDFNAYQNNPPSKKLSISLAAKWAPSENHHFDKRYKLARKLADLIFPIKENPKKEYRKLLSVLRNHLNIVERLMCENKWDEIVFDTVPSRAHHILKKSFGRHQSDRYKKYLSSVEKGETKINTSVLHPHEIVLEASKGLNDTVELQWKAVLEKMKSLGTLNNCLAMVDVSGSMLSPYKNSVTCPMDVAIAMGILVSELNTGVYHRKFLSFSNSPRYHELQGTSLYSQIQNLKRVDWDMNTDLQKALLMILETATTNKVLPTYMPRSLFIFSDMQFDSCGSKKTNFQCMKEKFFNFDYTLPQIVFWNLSGKIDDVPVTINDDGVILLSGFSPFLLQQLMEGEDLSAFHFMLKAISKYDVLVDEFER